MLRAVRFRVILSLSTTVLCCMLGCGKDDEAIRAKSRADRVSARRWAQPRSMKSLNQRITLWWDAVPDEVQGTCTSSETSNIHPTDYAGAEACRKCHEKNYEGWAKHPHRWMNAVADESTVKGDFSGVSISYMGGTATFQRDSDAFQMLLKRGVHERRYQITRTIGSRFYQYYVGIQQSGPEKDSNPIYNTDHVLPFGYWLDQQEWIPIVHVSDKLRYEPADDVREDPFLAEDFSPYTQCNSCHTTFAMGDLLSRDSNLVSRHTPRKLHWNLHGYLKSFHTELVGDDEPTQFSDVRLKKVSETVNDFDAPTHAVNLGISCEACHLGAKAHAAGEVKRPAFFPHSRACVRIVGSRIQAGFQ